MNHLLIYNFQIYCQADCVSYFVSQSFMFMSHSKKDMSTSSPSSETVTQNQTYQRALNAFFQGEVIPQALQQRLPDEVEGLSVRRSQCIQQVKQADSERSRLEALMRLNRDFGLPNDLEILYHALTPDQNQLNLVALQLLHTYLQTHDADAWREPLQERLELLQVRSFDAQVLDMVNQCLMGL